MRCCSTGLLFLVAIKKPATFELGLRQRLGRYAENKKTPFAWVYQFSFCQLAASNGNEDVTIRSQLSRSQLLSPNLTVFSSTGTGSCTDCNYTAGNYYIYTLTVNNNWVSCKSLAIASTIGVSGSSSATSSGNGAQISLNWPAIPTISSTSGSTKYVVQVSSSANGQYSNVNGTITVNTSTGAVTFTDNSAVQGQTYYYRIVATNPSGGVSYSQPIAIYICVSGLAASATISGLYLPFTSPTIMAQNVASGTPVKNPLLNITTPYVSPYATLIVGASQSIKFHPGFTAAAKSYMKAYIVTACGSKKSEEVDSTGEKSVTAIPEENTVYTIKIYPNPTTGMLTIETGADKATVGIYNIYGSLLKLQKLVGSINQTDISNFKPGTYIVKVVTNTGQQKALIEIKK